MEEIRLQKFFSDAGVMSRRHAEAAIAEGRVTVNGVTAEVGMKVDPWYDTITLDGKEIKPRTIEAYTYINIRICGRDESRSYKHFLDIYYYVPGPEE